MFTNHIEIHVDYLISCATQFSGVKKLNVKPFSLEYLNGLKARGIVVINDCPSPLANGSCPGHISLE